MQGTRSRSTRCRSDCLGPCWQSNRRCARWMNGVIAIPTGSKPGGGAICSRHWLAHREQPLTSRPPRHRSVSATDGFGPCCDDRICRATEVTRYLPPPRGARKKRLNAGAEAIIQQAIDQHYAKRAGQACKVWPLRSPGAAKRLAWQRRVTTPSRRGCERAITRGWFVDVRERVKPGRWLCSRGHIPVPRRLGSGSRSTRSRPASHMPAQAGLAGPTRSYGRALASLGQAACPRIRPGSRA
jgi:hypothetical protein